MKEIRNPDGRLVCRINGAAEEIEIVEKGWVTVIGYSREGKVKITHHHRPKPSAQKN